MLSHCYLKEQDWNKAIHYADRALNSNPLNIDALQALMVAYRYTDQKEKAYAVKKRTEREIPLSHPLRYEEFLLNPDNDKDVFLCLVRSEMPWETCLELAEWYIEAGLYQEALQLLDMTGEHPMAFYWKAFVLNKTGQSLAAKKVLEQTIALSPAYIFPFRLMDQTALIWDRTQTDSWKTNYYLSLLYWHWGDKNNALSYMNNNDAADYAPLFISRSKLKSGEDRLTDLLQAEKLEPSWRVGLELLNYHLAMGEYGEAVHTGARYMQKYPNNYILGLKYSKALYSQVNMQKVYPCLND